MEDRTGAAFDRVIGNTANAVASGALIPHVGLDTASLAASALGSLAEEISFLTRKGSVIGIRRVRRLLARSAEEADVTETELLKAVGSSEHKLDLFMQAMDAARYSRAEAKIDALARAFVTGVFAEDPDTVEEQIIITNTLAQLEMADLRLLSLLSKEAPHEIPDERQEKLRFAWRRDEIVTDEPGLLNVLDAAIAKTHGLGLIYDEGIGRLGYRPYWKLTEFGCACIQAMVNRVE